MPRHQYGDYQKEIYLNGLNGKLPVYPVDYASLERAAAKVLPSWVYSHVAYGAGDGNTQRGVKGHEELPSGGHENCPVVAMRSAHSRPPDVPPA